MRKTVVAALAALAIFGTDTLAQSQCDQAKLNQKVDRLSLQPFSALNWRVLNGLGDPGIDPSIAYHSWESEDAYKKLSQSILKTAEAPAIGYECRIDYPLSVLKGHIAKFGEADPYVAQWAKVQQQVFAACSDPASVNMQLPDPLVGIDAARETAQRDDRAYQAASIAFYADKTKAVEMFRAIAASASPHKAAARYNVANLLANGKQLEAARKEASAILADPALASVHTITKELQGYIANLEDTADGWSALIADASETIMRPTADIMSSADHQSEFARALSDIDYAGVRGKDSDWWLRGELPENPTISKALVDASRASPMALWMIGGQSLRDKQQSLPWAMRGDKWRGYAADYTGRVLAVPGAGAQIPSLARDMLTSLAGGAPADAAWQKANEAAKKASDSCGDAPETAALALYLDQAAMASAISGDFARVYAEIAKSPIRGSELLNLQVVRDLMAYTLATGNVAEARKLRDTLLSEQSLQQLPEQIRTALKEETERFKAWVAEDEPAWRSAVIAGSARSSSPLLNLLSASQLRSLSDDTRFSGEERALFARVAWTRDYALGRATKANALQQLLQADARLKTSYEALQKEFPKLSPERLQLLFVLRNPRLGILVNSPDSWSQTGLELSADSSYEELGEGDHNDRNWWCPFEPDRQFGAVRTAYNGDARIQPLDDFYNKDRVQPVYDSKLYETVVAGREKLLKAHPVVKSTDWKALAALTKAASAPRKLTEAALAWGKASKGEDGAPEALARAVAATRYGCNWHGGHGKYSRPAQELLKAKFAASPYAAQTPYWFDCMRNEWDDKGERVTTCKPKDWPKQQPLR